MKCLAIDDEPMALDILEDYINKIPFLTLTGTFRNSLKALDYFQNNNIDLLFLDINMPDLTGIQFLNSLSHPPLVIFTTAYSKYAVESYEFQAVDYLLKPIEFSRFLKAANRAYEKFKLLTKTQHFPPENTNTKNEDGFVFIKSGTEIHQLKIRDIFYIESAGNYVIFHSQGLNNKKIMSLFSMNKVLEMLPQNQFVRIHKSYIINIKKITLVEKHQVQLNNIFLPIGKIYKKHFFYFLGK